LSIIDFSYPSVAIKEMPAAEEGRYRFH